MFSYLFGSLEIYSPLSVNTINTESYAYRNQI